MIINQPPVTYSSIVKIGEDINELEKNSGHKYLKLHRGIMDVTTIDLNAIVGDFDFNLKSLQHYGPNNGDVDLIKTIKTKFHLNDHHILITPGGMAALDLTINSIFNTNFKVPRYHWGSWNKILKVHNKEITSFNDFDLKNTHFQEDDVYMLCVPSNPTGWAPKLDDLKEFIERAQKSNVTVILDLPYYYLFNHEDDKIYELFYDNVIVISSFSKSLGLPGFRIGYVATKNQNLFDAMKIRSLYKYNSISNLPQSVVEEVLNIGFRFVRKYKEKTVNDIQQNIDYLEKRGFIFEEYPSKPVGPFCIINLDYDTLLKHKISSVPLNKFSIDKDVSDQYSRISVAVNHNDFVKYFDGILN